MKQAKTGGTGLLILGLLAGCGRGGGAHGKRVIVLGVDGMDPHFVEQHWDALPNLRRLRDRGGLTRLATTTPPQSPVAWSTFITGTDPEQHGIFDFVRRDPVTQEPRSWMAETLEPAHQLRIGPYLLPLSKARVQSFRAGRAFWEILAEHDIPVTVIHMPTNYPPARHAGQALAGMGAPDLEGTFGTFTYYTDDPLEPARELNGGRIVQVAMEGNRVTLPVYGPPNPLRGDHARPRMDLVADIDPEAPVMRGRIGGQQFILREGEWSPWIRVHFTLLPGLESTAGMFRLYARELHPGVRIYRSPLNADPSDPALPISAPAGYSREVAGRLGPFYTQGIEEDTSALRQGALDLPEYMEQSRLVMAEHARLLRDCLQHFREGFLFFYFSEVDQNSHMLWGRHEAELLETYQAVDRAIGEALDQSGGATVMVMSDHGFAAFDRAVNLNTWLEREGFGKTKARAVGLNALYVQDKTVLPTLMPKLTSLLDPYTGERVIADLTTVGKTATAFAPDLIVGYAPGYRASWETALGEAPPAPVIEPNRDAWIGDHCISARAVPGVLLGTRRPVVQDPRLKDLSVTILREFGIGPDAAMTGREVY